MKIKGLDGRTHIWTLQNKPRENASGPHLKARELLKKLFPLDSILEELHLPGCGLYIDFFLPGRKLMVEVQGEQHYKEVTFFHKNKLGYADSLKRDNRKREWAILNGFRLVELNEKEEEGWTGQILE